MLALSRKQGESIVIGNDIEITILDIKGDQVRIGISAPKTIPIFRKELYVSIEAENKAAATSEGTPEVIKNFFKS